MFIVFYRYLRGWQQVPPHGRGRWKRRMATGTTVENKARLVFWEVTKGCNLRCIHCRATATELSSPTDLPTATALGIIDQIAAAANPILVLSGGEPLYRSDIFQLARYANRQGSARRPGHQRHAGHERRRAHDRRFRRQPRFDQSGWRRCGNPRRLPRNPRSVRCSRARPSKSESAWHVGADQHDHRASQRASTARCSPVGP